MSIPRIQSYQIPQDLPENKVSWAIEPKKAVLLVHDMQQYFLDFYDIKQQPIPELVNNTKRLIEFARKHSIPVIYTAQPGNQTPEHRQLLTDFWGTGLIDDPHITQILPEISPKDGDIILEKWRYSAFKFSNLLERMEQANRNQMLICGVYAHIGCLASALEAFMFNIKPFLVADAVADFSLDEHYMALKYVASRCGQVIQTDAVVQISLSELEIRLTVAKELNMPIEEIEDDDNLVLLGMNSVQLMTLAGRWKSRGIAVSFETLAEDPCLSAWIKKILNP